MSITLLPNQYTINGVLPTEDSALANLEKLAASSGCWITYDIHQGKWSVIINRAGVSSRSFDDFNIIGSISVQGTGLTELYNSVRVSYPRSDINDVIDFIQIDLLPQDRNFNEPDQALEMELPLTNDPVQAQLIGLIELKQNRVDKVIVFETDYTAIDVNAGDIIDVSNSTAGFNQKLFRVITMRELDGDDGGIRIEITALEYDAAVYDADLSRVTVTNSNGIVTTGAIGQPGTPTLNIFERDTRPRTVISTTVPAGLVNGIEFWLSQTSSSSGFQLVGIERPADSTVFAQGTTVTLDVDNINAGEVYVQTRAFNATVDGPFSAVTTGAYTPVQTPAAVNPDTAIVDSNGNLLTALVITELLKLVDGLKSDGDGGSGSLFEAIFDVFDQETGTDLQDVTYSETFNSEVDISTTVTKLTAMSATANDNYVYDTNNTNNRNNWIVAPSLTLPETYSAVNVDIRTPTCEMSYDFLDQNNVERTATIFAQPAFSIRVLFNPAGAAPNLFTATLLEASTVDWTSNFARVSLTRDLNVGPFLPAGTYWVALQLIPSYDLNMHWPVRDGASVIPQHIYFYDFVAFSGTTFTLTGLRAPQ